MQQRSPVLKVPTLKVKWESPVLIACIVAQGTVCKLVAGLDSCLRVPVCHSPRRDGHDQPLGLADAVSQRSLLWFFALINIPKSVATYSFIPPSSPSLPPPLAKALSILEPYREEKKASEGLRAKEGPDQKAIPPIPGGGLARRIFASLDDASKSDRRAGSATKWSVPIVGILHYVFEGDNRGDAGILLAVVNRLLHLDIQGM